MDRDKEPKEMQSVNAGEAERLMFVQYLRELRSEQSYRRRNYDQEPTDYVLSTAQVLFRTPRRRSVRQSTPLARAK